MTGALTAVLDTNELLEHVLSHFDSLEAIVAAQRVCKHWRALVESSLRLQRAIFRAPNLIRPSSFQPSGCPRYDAAVQINPCFVWDTVLLSFSSKVGYIHNIMSSRNLGICTSSNREEDTIDPYPEYDGRMRQFVTQPASTTIRFRLMRSKQSGRTFTSGSLHRKDGIRIEDVKYVVRSVWSQFERAGLFKDFSGFLADFVLDFEDMKRDWQWPSCGDNDPEDTEYARSDSDSEDEHDDEVEDEEAFPDDWPAEFGIGMEYQ